MIVYEREINLKKKKTFVFPAFFFFFFFFFFFYIKERVVLIFSWKERGREGKEDLLPPGPFF